MPSAGKKKEKEAPFSLLELAIDGRRGKKRGAIRRHRHGERKRGGKREGVRPIAWKRFIKREGNEASVIQASLPGEKRRNLEANAAREEREGEVRQASPNGREKGGEGKGVDNETRPEKRRLSFSSPFRKGRRRRERVRAEFEKNFLAEGKGGKKPNCQPSSYRLAAGKEGKGKEGLPVIRSQAKMYRLRGGGGGGKSHKSIALKSPIFWRGREKKEASR